MIYHVDEWVSGSHSSFFFDATKVDQASPFEVAYLDLLKRAAATPERSIQTKLDGALNERCGRYQEGARPWTRLLRKPPCQVSKSVTIWAE